MNLIPIFVLELVAFVGLSTALALRFSRLRARLTLVAAGILVATAAFAWSGQRIDRQASRQELVQELPVAGEEKGYVSSTTCRSCHPNEYSTWYRTYHRTMTRPATPEYVKGDFSSQTIRRGTWTYSIERRGDEFWADMVDPDWERLNRLRGADVDSIADPPRVERRLVMITGSHHMQTYWVASQFGNELLNFPFVYLFEDRRWVPREDVFLRPPTMDRFTDFWNDNCLECHSTRGVPGLTPESEAFTTRAAEIGIACEACHGPGQEHVRLNRNPLRRYTLHSAGEGDSSIIQPERLDSRQASAVCGQCHGVALSDARQWLAEGHSYKPGEALEDSRFLILPTQNRQHPRIQRLLEQQPASLDSRFWSDGIVRVSGREYTGMVESPCFKRGELSCLSCHSMHDSDPDDQLAAAMETDEACFQCHGEYRAKVAEHSRHPVGSSGASCYDCHMPHTSYGLLTAMRSHTISSPTVTESLTTGRPNACNLCHLDKTLAWTADELHKGWGQARPDLKGAERSVAASLLWLLAGDAGQRAVVAWSLGWEPAKAASGTEWQAPFLGHALNDPYSAVRYIAHLSLQSYDGFQDLPYDYIAAPEERAQARQLAIDRWLRRTWNPATYRGRQVLMGRDGNLDVDALIALAQQRNDRPIALGE